MRGIAGPVNKPASPAAVCVIAALLALCNLSCIKDADIRYETNVDRNRLVALKGKMIGILPVRYNQKAFSGTPVSPSIVSPLLDQHQKVFESEFGTIFSIKLIADADGNAQIGPADTDLIKKIAKDLSLAGVFVIDCAYGFSDDNGTQFFYASNTHLVDAEGQVVWNFYGKEWGLQGLGEGLGVGEVLRKTIDDDTVPSGFGRTMIAMTQNYVPFLRWLMEADMDGNPKKNYFVDYPKEKRNKDLLLYPATVKTSPYLTDATGAK
jgi:hypothetical protein